MRCPLVSIFLNHKGIIMNQSHQAAVQGGLQCWSVKAPYPFVVMAIDNPQGMPKGIYWYVVDSRKGSRAFKDREGVTAKGPLGSEWAHCHASALYLYHIEGLPRHEANKAYDPYWDKVGEVRKGF